MSDTKELLQRARERFVPPDDVMASLERRRIRKGRNRRIFAAMLAIVITILSFMGLMDAFRNAERPNDEPTPTPPDSGIFSDLGGWIAYGDTGGIWAIDPGQPGDPNARVDLSTALGEPVAWSSDGSKLLILERSGRALSVLNADGTETLLVEVGARHVLSGGSFSPDGSTVVYADTSFGGRDAILTVSADGGTPRRILAAKRRWYPALGRRARSMLYSPTFSPDGTKVAYFDGLGDHSASLRVMNADGSGIRVLLKDDGVMREDAFAEHLGWSPDGTRLAFDFGYSGAIYVVGADGSGLTLLIADAVDPYWSPDGSSIAGVRADGLVIADANGQHAQEFGYGRSGPWNPLDPTGPGSGEGSGTT